MIVIDNLMQVANQIESERGVSKEVLFSAIEQALVAACRKKMPEEADLYAKLDLKTGVAQLFQIKIAVKKVEDEVMEISLQDAKKYNKDVKEEEEVYVPIETEEFGRIAAQTAKQVIIQRIREAEKQSVFDEYQDKIGQILTGTVQRVENRNYLVNLGRTEAVLQLKDQIPGETFHAKDKIRVYIVNIDKGPRGNSIHISRTHPGLLQRLFELEIPEIQEGIISIMAVSREAGKRSKIAVKSNNASIGAVGTCVGQMGGRIQSIIKELGNEKIDVLEWSENPQQFIANALKPAKISQVSITNAEEKTATVIVPDDQLSLAIGKQGINVRLSVRLTGWKLDVIPESGQGSTLSNAERQNLSIAEKIQLSKEKLLVEETETDAPEMSSLAAAIKKASEEAKNEIDETEENKAE